MRALHACPFLILLPAIGLADVTRVANVEVRYEGIDSTQARALGETLSAARLVYIEQYGFDMPEKVTLEARCGPKESTRLWTDGQDRLYLSIPSRDKLRRPAVSGVFNLYGMCHELGHMAMYRTLKNRDWMTTAAAEGWAHYAGSVVVDHVYAAKGEKLWPDPYDYREDGTARLRRQLESRSKSSPVTQGAGQWLKLEGIIGRAGFPKLFAAWQAAKIDPTEPESELLAVLVKTVPDKKEALEEWWKIAGPVLVEKRAKSQMKAETMPASELSDRPILLKLDDDTSESKQSIAGGGHARSFRSPVAGRLYITAAWVYGGRYGGLKPVSDLFDIALCDKDMAMIAVWKKPYGLFGGGGMEWVRIPLPPTRVPEEFNVCVAFKPTASKGVYVGYDNSTHGSSRVAIPGKQGGSFNKGDWMIRVELSQPKDADSLKAEP